MKKLFICLAVGFTVVTLSVSISLSFARIGHSEGLCTEKVCECHCDTFLPVREHTMKQEDND